MRTLIEQAQTVADVRRLVKEHDIEFIFASFSEIKGKSNAKLVPAAHVDELFTEGVGFAGMAAGEIGQGPHSPDATVSLDPRSFRIVPWQPGLAHVIGDVTVNGEEWPYCPRTILRRLVARAKEKGFVLKLGFEAEFMLVDFDEDGKLTVFDRQDVWDRPCYDVNGLTRQYEFVTKMSKYISELGWDNYAVDHEDANGQFECNVTFADVLETADRAVFFKYMTNTVAQQHGSVATFMPKPFTDNTGNGLHYTMSLWDAETDTNLFADPDDPRGFGLSKLGYQFTAGVLDHGRGCAAMVAPTVNSYKRLKAGTDQIRTWVPVFMAYGGNNRTQMLRIARAGAVEFRAPDFSGSPYLGMAAVLAAGLDGIERDLDPGEPNECNLYEVSLAEAARREIGVLPASLMEAVHYLKKDDVLRAALGRVPVDGPGGEESGATADFVDYYAEMKRNEFHEVTDIVTENEIKRYLTFP